MATANLDQDTIPVLTKTITQVKINQFESCGILDRQNIHNNPELPDRYSGSTAPETPRLWP